MRRLTKDNPPPVLVANAAKWTAELVQTIAAGQKPTDTQKGRYNQPAIKEALKAETKRKCAYCESKFEHVTYGDIEHVVPKSKVPSKSFDWFNLTMACDVCNTEKGDYFAAPGDDDHDTLIDPYVDDPDQFFMFMRELIHPKFGNARAHKTYQTLDLGRNPLVEARRTQLDAVSGVLESIALASPDMKPIYVNILRQKYLSEGSPYSNFAIHYINLLHQRGELPFVPT